MEKLTEERKKELLDSFGKSIIKEVRDGALRISTDIVKMETVNPVSRLQYQCLSGLSSEEQDALCDLLSQTVTSAIYRFLKMFDYKTESMRLLLTDESGEYDLTEISEEVGSEITFLNNEGWIQRFSKVGYYPVDTSIYAKQLSEQ